MPRWLQGRATAEGWMTLEEAKVIFEIDARAGELLRATAGGR